MYRYTIIAYARMWSRNLFIFYLRIILSLMINLRDRFFPVSRTNGLPLPRKEDRYVLYYRLIDGRYDWHI